MTTVQTENKSGISYALDQSILTERMSMQHLHTKFMPTILVEDQMEIRNSLNDQHKKQAYCQILSLGTNLGSFPLSLRWDVISVNGTLKYHAKKEKAAGYISGWHADHFFDNLDVMSRFLYDKEWIPLFIQKFWNMWGMSLTLSARPPFQNFSTPVF
jgi:hypothetical protein